MVATANSPKSNEKTSYSFGGRPIIRNKMSISEQVLPGNPGRSPLASEDLPEKGGVFCLVVGGGGRRLVGGRDGEDVGGSRRAGVWGPEHGGLWCRGPCVGCAGGRLAQAPEAEKGCGVHPGERFLLGWMQPHSFCRKRRVGRCRGLLAT